MSAVVMLDIMSWFLCATSDKARQRKLRAGVASCVCAIPLALVTAFHGIAQQACNPAIDGTYCATAGIRSTPAAPSTDARRDIGLGQAISGAGLYEQPATLGAITFSSAGRCVGLIRRVNCKD